MQAILLALFLLAGEFKADPRLAWIPIDLTVMLGLLLGIVTAYRVMTQDLRFQHQLTHQIIGTVVFAIPLLWTVWTDLAVDKVSRMFTLTLISFFAPLFLIRSRSDLRTLLKAVTVIALLIALDAASILAQEFGNWNEAARLTASGSNTIALGRMCGLGIVAALVFRGRKPWIQVTIQVLALVVLVPVMFASGSRGPLLAIVITAAVMFGLFHARSLKHWLVLILLGVVFVGGLVAGSFLAPEQSRGRIQMFFGSGAFEDTRANASVATRTKAIRLAVDTIVETPFGLGWGGYAGIAQGLDVTYPHNLLLELFVEGGWIPGVLFCTALIAALMRGGMAALRSTTVEERWTLLIAVNMFVNSLVSGDINDNRLLFAFLAVTAMVSDLPKGASREGSTESTLLQQMRRHSAKGGKQHAKRSVGGYTSSI